MGNIILFYKDKDNNWVDLNNGDYILEKGLQANFTLDTSQATIAFSYVNSSMTELEQLTILKSEIFATPTDTTPTKTDYWYVNSDKPTMITSNGKYRHTVNAFEPFGRLVTKTTDASGITQ